MTDFRLAAERPERNSNSLTVRGTVLQTPTADGFEILEDVLITVVNGIITSINPFSCIAPEALPPDITLSSPDFLIPGLIDLHVHAPQFPQLGLGFDVQLEQWLHTYTFKTESRYSDLDYATSMWNVLVPTLLSEGTTTAVYYSSIHVPATTALAESCIRFGQRAYVGRVAMDHPLTTPSYYRDADASHALAKTRESISAIRSLSDPFSLVRPIITPRFIPACTDNLLRDLGALAEELQVPVQTHVSESHWEHTHVLDRCGKSDTCALKSFGLLRPRTVLAHAIHASDADLEQIKEAHAGIAHCPLSNMYFGDGTLRAKDLLRSGVNIGLGTDIAGGACTSILRQMAHACNVSNGFGSSKENERVSATTSFYMGTRGAANVLGENLGLLRPGWPFDAVRIRLPFAEHEHTNVCNYEHKLERLVRMSSKENVKTVWVNGRCVSGEKDV